MKKGMLLTLSILLFGCVINTGGSPTILDLRVGSGGTSAHILCCPGVYLKDSTRAIKLKVFGVEDTGEVKLFAVAGRRIDEGDGIRAPFDIAVSAGPQVVTVTTDHIKLQSPRNVAFEAVDGHRYVIFPWYSDLRAISESNGTLGNRLCLRDQLPVDRS